MTTPTEDRLGSYRLGERLGRGASGVVRIATSSAYPDPVAIKILRDDLADDERTVARFMREKRITSGVDHPNVVKVNDLVVEDEQLGIVMELIDGHDLKTLIADEAITPTDAIDIARQIAAGLVHLHKIGVFHRDLKPGNVMVSGLPGEREVKITDFGVSWLVNETMTRLTTTVGTPLYMAPEVTSAAGADQTSDVYALGVLLYEMLVGAVPCYADNPMGIVMAHTNHPTPELNGVPVEVSALVAELMSKAGDDRPTAAETAKRLKGIAPLIDDEMEIGAKSPLPNGHAGSDRPPLVLAAAENGSKVDAVARAAPSVTAGLVGLARSPRGVAAGALIALLTLTGLTAIVLGRGGSEAVAADAGSGEPTATDSAVTLFSAAPAANQVANNNGNSGRSVLS